MINGLYISGILGAVVAICSEILRTQKVIRNETSRKILHIVHGLVVATWPFFASYYFIIVAEVLFLMVVLIARIFRIMQPLRNVNRTSWGEIFFPIAVISLALLFPPPWLFVAAMLHLGLADAVAALVGQKFVKGRYHVLGQSKSIAGSLAFFIVSVGILVWLVNYSPANYPLAHLPLVLLVVPVIATFTENISPYGSDNFSVPLVVLGLLSFLATK